MELQMDYFQSGAAPTLYLPPVAQCLGVLLFPFVVLMSAVAWEKARRAPPEEDPARIYRRAMRWPRLGSGIALCLMLLGVLTSFSMIRLGLERSMPSEGPHVMPMPSLERASLILLPTHTGVFLLGLYGSSALFFRIAACALVRRRGHTRSLPDCHEGHEGGSWTCEEGASNKDKR